MSTDNTAMLHFHEFTAMLEYFHTQQRDKKRFEQHLISIHDPYELQPPESKCLFQGETNTFEKESILLTTPVLQMVMFTQALVQALHAKRKRRLRELEENTQHSTISNMLRNVLPIETTGLSTLDSNAELFRDCGFGFPPELSLTNNSQCMNH